MDGNPDFLRNAESRKMFSKGCTYDKSFHIPTVKP